MSKEKKYYQGLGRRKTTSVLVRLQKGEGKKILVNEKPDLEYFENGEEARKIFLRPLELTGNLGKFDIQARIKGGGKKAQIDALRLAIARALIEYEKDLRPTLRKAGFLTRDSRVKERKKPGLKRARRAPQWQKR